MREETTVEAWKQKLREREAQTMMMGQMMKCWGEPVQGRHVSSWLVMQKTQPV
jgi:hypothetical protein